VIGEEARGSETEVDEDPSSVQSAWIATLDSAFLDVSNSTTPRQNSVRWLRREACLLIKLVPKSNVSGTRISILKLDLKTLCARVGCGTHIDLLFYMYEPFGILFLFILLTIVLEVNFLWPT
jgi:hypothetical protein